MKRSVQCLNLKTVCASQVLFYKTGISYVQLVSTFKLLGHFLDMLNTITTTNISSDHNDIEKEIVHASELYRKFAQHFYHKQLILRCSGMARVNKGSHSFTCHPHVYPQVE